MIWLHRSERHFFWIWCRTLFKASTHHEPAAQEVHHIQEVHRGTSCALDSLLFPWKGNLLDTAKQCVSQQNDHENPQRWGPMTSSIDSTVLIRHRNNVSSCCHAWTHIVDRINPPAGMYQLSSVKGPNLPDCLPSAKPRLAWDRTYDISQNDHIIIAWSHSMTMHDNVWHILTHQRHSKTMKGYSPYFCWCPALKRTKGTLQNHQPQARDSWNSCKKTCSFRALLLSSKMQQDAARMLPYLFFDPLLFLEDWRSVKMGQSKRTKKLNWICMLTFRVPGFVQIWVFQVHIPNGSTVFSHFGWSRCFCTFALYSSVKSAH